MKKWLLSASVCCLFADVTGFAADAGRGASEGLATVPAVVTPVPSTVVVTPGTATVVVQGPTVVVTPQQPQPAAAPAVAPAVPAAPKPAAENDEPPPPPEPPAADAAEPRRLVRYFCKAWKDKDWERLWWAMSPEYRKKVALKKFKKFFESDAEMNGGLIDENIIGTAKTNNGNEGVKLELIFKFPRAQHRFVTAVAERQPGGAFRIVESPLIPKDLDDL